MTLVEPGQKIILEPNFLVQYLYSHNSFIGTTWGLDFTLPVGHNPANDIVIQSFPIAIDRGNNEATERKSIEAMIELSVMLTRVCSEKILAAGPEPVKLTRSALDSWIAEQHKTIRQNLRFRCGVDAIVDVELYDAITSDSTEGYEYTPAPKTRLLPIEQKDQFREGFYVFVTPQHILSLYSHLILELTSKIDSEGQETWQYALSFSYNPDLSNFFTEVKIGRVEVDSSILPKTLFD